MGVVSGWIDNTKDRVGDREVKLLAIIRDGSVLTAPDNECFDLYVTDRCRKIIFYYF